MRRSPSVRQRAFTVAEFLVCFGVLALIVALMLPSFARSRHLVRMVQCANNEHHIGITTTQFCLDHKMLFPDFIYSWEPGNSSSGVILIHFQPKWAVTTGWAHYDPKAMICPSDPAPNEVQFLDNFGDLITQRCSYDVNIDFLIRDHRYDVVKSPSQLAWLWDGDVGEPAKQGAYMGTEATVRGSLITRHMVPNHLLAQASIRSPLAMIDPFTPRAFAPGNGNGNNQGGGDEPQGGLANVLWVDNHVSQERALKLDDIVMFGESALGGPGNSGSN